MMLNVQLFGVLADKIAAAAVAVELPDGATVADLLAQLARDHPAVAAMHDRLAVAVNMAYVKPDHQLHEGDEVALIPPVSGG